MVKAFKSSVEKKILQYCIGLIRSLLASSEVKSLLVIYARSLLSSESYLDAKTIATTGKVSNRMDNNSKLTKNGDIEGLLKYYRCNNSGCSSVHQDLILDQYNQLEIINNIKKLKTRNIELIGNGQTIISLVKSCLSTDFSGGSVRGHSIHMELVKRGFKVIPIVINTNKEVEYSEKNATIIDNINYIIAPRFTGERHANIHILGAWLESYLKEESINPDIVWAHSGVLGYDTAIIGAHVRSKFNNSSLLYEVRSFHESSWGEDEFGDKKLTLLRKKIEQYIMEKSDKVVCICNTMKNQIAKRGIPKDKVLVVPNFISHDIYQGLLENEGVAKAREARYRLLQDKNDACVTLGYVSGFHPREGHFNLLDAFKLLVSDQNLDLNLILVGNGSTLDSVKDKVVDLGIESRVKFYSSVKHKDVANYYQKIDLFVIPRMPDYAGDFVTPMKPYEAMAAGLVCVYSPRPALKECFSNTLGNFMAESHTDKHLAEAIKSALEKINKWIAISRSNREAVLRNNSTFNINNIK